MGTPCARMHCAWWSRLSLVLSGIPPCGPPPGRSLLRHVCAADWNAGDCVSASGILMPPPALGSGKLATPCERMHSANASCGLTEAPVRLDLPDDPQAASASAQVAAANAMVYNAIGRRCRCLECRLRCRLLIVSTCLSSAGACQARRM